MRALFWYHAHVACSELPRLLAVSQARANWISCAVVKDWLSPPRQAPAALPWPCVACAPGRTHFLPWRPSRPAAGVQGAVVFMSPTTPHYGHLPEACIPGLLESLHPLVCQLCTTAGPYTRQIERHGAAGCQEPGTWSHWVLAVVESHRERSMVYRTDSRLGEFYFCYLLAVWL